VRNTLALVGLSVVGLGVVAAARAEQRLHSGIGDRPASIILEIPLDGLFVSEEEPQEELANWRRLWRRFPFSASRAPASVSLWQLTRAVEDASKDPRVVGILTTAGSNQARAFSSYANPIGAIEELSNAIGAFRQSGRPTAFYASSFENTATYFLAAAHEQIYMHSTGIWNAVGLSAGSLFLRDFLDARGIRVEVIRCGEYKTAANAFTESAYTTAHREAVQAVLSTFYAAIIGAIAAARQTERQRVEALIDAAPLSAPETMEAGLVDALVYPDGVRQRMRALVLTRMQMRANERQEARARLEKILNSPEALNQLSDTVESWLLTRPWEATPPWNQKGSASEWMALFDTLNRARPSTKSEQQEPDMDAALACMQRARRLLDSVAESNSWANRASTASPPRVERQGGPKRRPATDDLEDGLRFCSVTQYMAERSSSRSRLRKSQQRWSAWLKERFLHPASFKADQAAPFPMIAMIPVTGVLSETSVQVPVKALTKARKDPRVCAVILRIASPGGTVTASENIRHAVEACANEKPVIASLGHVAASGGYLAALAANYILAPACSITGSIGVILLKPNLLDAANRLGIQFDHVSLGKNASHFAALSSLFQKLQKDQHDRLESLVQWQYAFFCEKVARFRHLDEAAVQNIAQGRVWSGSDAVRLGIVDQRGGLLEAIKLARKAAKLSPWDSVHLDSRYGRPSSSLIDLLRQLLGQDRDDMEQGNVVEAQLWSVLATAPVAARAWIHQYVQMTAWASLQEPMALWLEGVGFLVDS
jgi:signal peptide peptidase SppA